MTSESPVQNDARRIVLPYANRIMHTKSESGFSRTTSLEADSAS